MKANLNALRYKATLNEQGTKELDNGNVIPVNEKLFDFRFGYYKQSLNQNIEAGLLDQLVDTVTIFARHSENFASDGQHSITINGVDYNIQSINPDYDINGLDTITLKKVGS